MDALLNKEKPFTDPDFNQQALAEFMEVDIETFIQLVPRYKDPMLTLICVLFEKRSPRKLLLSGASF